MILSGSEPSELQDSSDEDEDSTMEGNNPNNPIIMSNETNSIIELSEDSFEREEIVDHRYNPEVSYRKRLTSTDVTGSRLYLGASFAAHLTLFGHGSIWQIAGPSSSGDNNVFFFYLLKNGLLAKPPNRSDNSKILKLADALPSESLLSSVFLFTHACPPMASCVLVDHRYQWLPSILPVKTTLTRSVTARLITGWFSIRLE
ncbi:uncharacterized protein DS421_20g697020 [Arachis hypogaea]|nr:uncharacterized protein DS421_20g697020 [Arachis hypogaea]